MRKIVFAAAILSFVLGQAICLAETNEPDTNSIRSRLHRLHGVYRSEQAVINWHDGIQQMVVLPRIVQDNSSIWIFPLKCKSEQIKFNLVSNAPQLSGADPREIAQNVLINVNYGIIATQLWTIPLCYFWAEKPNYSFGVRITGSIDSNGVRMELLKADSVQALAQQLKDRGRIIPEKELDQYAKYLNKEYSLLTVWREGNEPNLTQGRYTRSHWRRPCIYVEFPSEKLSYPMAQSSSGRGRVSLTIIGLWQIADQEGSNAFQCNQLISSDANVPNVFGPLPPKNILLTTVSRFGRGGRSDLTQNDLIFVPGRLKGMEYVDAISKMPYFMLIPLGIVILAVISYVSAGISGLLTYRKWRGFAPLGLWNLLSVLAVGIAMIYQKSPTGQMCRQNNWKTRIFLLVFSVLVVLLSFGLFALLKMPFAMQ